MNFNRFSAHYNPIFPDCKMQYASSCRCLICCKICFAQPFCPERSEGAVCASSHRIFVNGFFREEASRYKIKLPVSACCYKEVVIPWQRGDPAKVGNKSLNSLRIRQHCNIIDASEKLKGNMSKHIIQMPQTLYQVSMPENP